MDAELLRERLAEVFDWSIEFHGFTTYLRDYEIIFHIAGNSQARFPPATLRYLFRYCVSAVVDTAVRPEVWAQSLGDQLLDLDANPSPDGYAWGVNWQGNYPGASIVDPSSRSAEWAARLGLPFHEVRFECNAHNVNLVFAELEVSDVPAGYAPNRSP